MRYLLLSFLLLALGCADAPDPSAPDTVPDAATTDAATDIPDDLAALESAYVETPLQNEHVDVHRVTLPAGAAIAPHMGGPRIVYSLGAYTLRFETDDTTETNSFAEGDVHYHDGGMHAVENTGSEDAAYVVFERREGALPEGAAPDELPAAEGATDEVLFENDFAEVHRVTLQPGATLPPHQGYARAIYSLSGYTVEFTDAEGTREQRFEAGQAHYHDPGDHTVENAGTTVAEFLVVEFKR